MINTSPEQLRRAADLAEQIQSLEAEFDRILAGLVPSHAGAAVPRKRKMSAAGRAAISAAAKAGWARARSKKPAAKPVRKKRRGMTAAARARISAIAKARWASAKKAGKSKL